jgi:hypothetical protein
MSRFEPLGFELHRAVLNSDELGVLLELVTGPTSSAGVRVFSNPQLDNWLTDGPVGRLARSVLSSAPRAVRAILFEKTQQTNWALGWHQDRTIAVRERVDSRGFNNWNRKSGVDHVEPPFSFIENMLTVRIHIDPVDENNAPLLVSPRSHRCGRIAEADISNVVERCGTAACLAERGDVWLYRTAILHASERSRSERSRRVLQIDFSAQELPDGLQWLGVA